MHRTAQALRLMPAWLKKWRLVMADKKQLSELFSGEAPVKRGKAYRLSTATQPANEQPGDQAEAPTTELSRNLEPKNSRKEEAVKRRKLGYEIREDLIRQW